jgi:hypothetical protein
LEDIYNTNRERNERGSIPLRGSNKLIHYIMKLIKLTTFYLNKKEELYVNPMHIGHMYEVPENADNRIKPKYTRVGVATHNNGGFEVLESTEEIIKLIEQA